jgi:uncharacterized protein YndB with AHSA1/START domain
MDERNSLDLAQDPSAIIATRIFDAPRERDFAAWTDPQHLAQWWGPIGFTTTTRAFDFRAGGVWRLVMHGPDGRDYENRIIYEQIVRPELLVYRHGGGADVEPVRFQVSVRFEDLGGKTRLTMRMMFPSPAERADIIAKYGADKGLVETLGRLTDYVARMGDNNAAAPEFVITRLIDAPRALVWQAFTEAAHLQHWWGPKGFKMVSCKLDLRPGGVFHYGMQAPDGSEMWGKWVFREIVAPERLAFVISFSDKAGGQIRHPYTPGWPLEMLGTTVFAEQDGKTLLTTRTIAFNATEAERRIFAAGFASMEQGFTGTFDQLDAYLARL